MAAAEIQKLLFSYYFLLRLQEANWKVVQCWSYKMTSESVLNLQG